MVFQNYALYPHMTVYNNMAFALKLRGMAKSEIDARVRAAAATLGIEGLLDRKPKALSGGQRQRVAVGRAIVREPKCFLFDEPLSNLDAKLRVTTRAELKALHLRLRTTTIYVTHDQEEAMTLGDRIVVMSNGLIQQAGPPLEVYHKPANRFVAAFVGMPPMNFFDGTIERRGEQFAFVPAAADATGRPAALAFPAFRSGKVSGLVGRPVVLGVRPQMFREVGGAEGEGSGAVITMPVRVTEPLGDTVDVFCGTAAQGHVVARVGAKTKAKAGETIVLSVDMGEAHVFEPGEFGRNLTA